MQPFSLFDASWVPDSVTTRQYLLLLATTADNNSIYWFIEQANQASVNSSVSQRIGISMPVDRQKFNRLADKAKTLFRSPGTMEIVRSPPFSQQDSINAVLLDFRPTIPQRDSLISLEAARIVLYFGGPRRADRILLGEGDLRPNKATMTRPSKASSSGSTGGGWDSPTKVRPRPKSSASIVKATRKSRIPSMKIEERVSDSIIRRPTKLPVQTAPERTMPKTVTPLASRPINQSSGYSFPQSLPQIKLPQPSVRKDDYPVNNQPQQVQQQQLSRDTELKQVYQTVTKCAADTLLYIATPKGSKQAIRPGIVVELSDSPNVYNLTLYCGSETQRVSSKQGFSHVKAEQNSDGSVRWLFYQNQRNNYKK